MKHFLSTIKNPVFVIACELVLTMCPIASHANSFSNLTGAVYTMTNSTSDNAIEAFSLGGYGTLEPIGVYSTGGKGTGSGLGSQGALALDASSRWLFAVNAGSNELSVFAVDQNVPVLTDKQPSGGLTPVSVTENRGLIYVLNAGNDSVTGFRMDRFGKLSPIATSTRYLGNTSTGAAQVQFSPDGEHLVVTEKSTNLIVVYPVDENGLLGTPQTTASPTPTPFGFAFGKNNVFIVSEANGGQASASSLSSYHISNDVASLVTTSAPTYQTAACWVAVTNDGRFAYTTNAGSGTISGFSISQNGHLQLVDANGQSADTGGSNSHPIDLTTSRHSAYLYSLNSGIGTISAFTIGHDGKLAYASTTQNVPLTSVGLVAR